MLSGVLSLIGGGIVNVNIQLASLKERVREVGVKMAIGAPGREIFKAFMTEALLLTAAGRASSGFVIGIAFSKIITDVDRHPAPHRRRRASCGRTSWPWSSASCSRSTRRGRPSRLSPMEALRYE